MTLCRVTARYEGADRPSLSTDTDQVGLSPGTGANDSHARWEKAELCPCRTIHQRKYNTGVYEYIRHHTFISFRRDAFPAGGG